MTTIFLFLALLAGECKVHRNNIPIDEQWLCRDAEIQGKPCWVQSHWFSCTVVEKCDTVKLPTWGRYPVFKGDRFFEADSNTYVIRCHPETTLVDSGVKGGILKWDYNGEHGIESFKLPTVTYPRPLDSADLADPREMPKQLKALSQEIRRLRRQMDFRTCLDTLNIKRQYYWRTLCDSLIVRDTLPHISVKDSCECVYGGKK